MENLENDLTYVIYIIYIYIYIYIYNAGSAYVIAKEKMSIKMKLIKSWKTDKEDCKDKS